MTEYNITVYAYIRVCIDSYCLTGCHIVSLANTTLCCTAPNRSEDDLEDMGHDLISYMILGLILYWVHIETRAEYSEGWNRLYLHYT